MNPIQGLRIPTPVGSPQAGGIQQGGGDGSFRSFLLDSIREVNTMQNDADLAVEKLVAGDDVNPAEVLTAVQKADIAFKLMMQIRNKMVQAYNDVQSIRI
ncbi:MAG: flagellar hook-basal body complex protein FliE [Thermoguttaceae bacterium]